MQLSVLFSMLAATVAVTSAYPDVFAACIESKDCCFSTKGACQRQATFAVETRFECGTIKLCPAFGVSTRDCNADCCSISTKKGRGCPGK